MGFEGMVVMIGIFVGLPWLILHYMTRWKTAPTLTVNDEALLDDLYQLAKRLEDRVETVERLVAADNPEFRQHRQLVDGRPDLPDLDQLEAEASLKARSRR